MDLISVGEKTELPRAYIYCDCTPILRFCVLEKPEDTRCDKCGAEMKFVDPGLDEFPEEL